MASSSAHEISYCSDDIHVDSNALEVCLLPDILVVVVEENRSVGDRHEAIGRDPQLDKWEEGERGGREGGREGREGGREGGSTQI